MASIRSHDEGRSAAAQSFSVSVLRDDGLRTRSFGSKNDAYDDLCPVNDANGRGARRGSGRLEDQRASPTSVAARRAYDDSGRRPDDVDDAQHPRDVDEVEQRLQRGSLMPRRRSMAPKRVLGPGLGTSDALRNASVVAAPAARRARGRRRGGLEPSRKKPRSGRDAAARLLTSRSTGLWLAGHD